MRKTVLKVGCVRIQEWVVVQGRQEDHEHGGWMTHNVSADPHSAGQSRQKMSCEISQMSRISTRK